MFSYHYRILSALANWSPIFGETQYLPVLAFPFVKLFQNNHLVCFEIIANIMGKFYNTGPGYLKLSS